MSQPDQPSSPLHDGPDFKHEYEDAGPSNRPCTRCLKERDVDDLDIDGVCLYCLGEKGATPSAEAPMPCEQPSFETGNTHMAGVAQNQEHGQEHPKTVGVMTGPPVHPQSLQETSERECIGINSVLKQIMDRFGPRTLTTNERTK